MQARNRNVIWNSNRSVLGLGACEALFTEVACSSGLNGASGNDRDYLDFSHGTEWVIDVWYFDERSDEMK